MYSFNLDDDFTVRAIWEGDVMTSECYSTLDEANEAANEAARIAEQTTVERGVYGDTSVQVIDGAGNVLSESLIRGMDHR